MSAPKINQAEYRQLQSLLPDYMVPGIDNLKNYGVTLLQENRRFIEAYMVGLKHEMGGELFWHGYPTDRRGTIFANSWDPIKADSPDIKEIHTWTGNFGANKKGLTSGSKSSLGPQGALISGYRGYVTRRDRVTEGELSGNLRPSGWLRTYGRSSTRLPLKGTFSSGHLSSSAGRLGPNWR